MISFIQRTSRQYGNSAALIKAVIKMVSTFNHKATSKADAKD